MVCPTVGRPVWGGKCPTGANPVVRTSGRIITNTSHPSKSSLFRTTVARTSGRKLGPSGSSHSTCPTHHRPTRRISDVGLNGNGAMQCPVMVHHPRGRMCTAEVKHYGAAACHGTAQRLQEHKSRAAGARHEATIESMTYKSIQSWALTNVCRCFLRDTDDR